MRKYFYKCVIRCWKRLSREAVESPTLEVFKKCVHQRIIQWLGLEMTPRIKFQPPCHRRPPASRRCCIWFSGKLVIGGWLMGGLDSLWGLFQPWWYYHSVMCMVKSVFIWRLRALVESPLRNWGLSELITMCVYVCVYTHKIKILLLGSHEIFTGKWKLHRFTVENCVLFSCVSGDGFWSLVFGYWHLKMLAFA